MALSQDALTTVAGVKQYLAIASTEHDGLLERLIEAVSAQFNAYTGRKLTARDYSYLSGDDAYDPDNALLSGAGYAELLLPQYPVLGLSSLVLDGREISPASGGVGWVLDAGAGVVTRLDGVFPRGAHNVGLVYRAGFETAPPDLVQAAIEQAAVRFQESGAGHGRLGVSARTLADGSVSYHAGALLPSVKAVLDRYRNRSLL
ncbi:MAG: phage gp6-like head-tail connector protein [Desulfarculaceae bacterium]|nr:phage gp6-like head-tail connector protein [Desulfarculaceae bacterium]MCF8072581.1 phage gp6-like head-tail connector protein [Desulfarculaceae bacterium]MCF8103347.1 phage gp6-like head-tail connector protein [Desulfarculaceae bacterium]MCF8117498.1 phage gp6-like head-tail connector protein [Desulfarculaceae bacterium]